MRRLTSLIITVLLATSMTGWAQSSMTDNQVVDFVIEQNAKGVSRQDIVTQLFKRGVTMDQLQRSIATGHRNPTIQARSDDGSVAATQEEV